MQCNKQYYEQNKETTALAKVATIEKTCKVIGSYLDHVPGNNN